MGDMRFWLRTTLAVAWVAMVIVGVRIAFPPAGRKPGKAVPVELLNAIGSARTPEEKDEAVRDAMDEIDPPNYTAWLVGGVLILSPFAAWSWWQSDGRYAAGARRRRAAALGALRPTCRVCRYSLTGNVSGVCPECGTPVARPNRPANKPSL